MHDNLDTVLRAGADQVAGAARPLDAKLVRARGDRFRRRAAAGLGRGPQVASPRGPLRLVAPGRYVDGVPNPVSFAIPGSGGPARITVVVDLGSPGYIVYRRPTLLRRDPATGRWLTVALTSRTGT